MKKKVVGLIAAAGVTGLVSAAEPSAQQAATQVSPQVQLETTLGVIVIQLDATAAPKTVANFLGYVKSGFYDGTIFHRVIEKFMIQGGGFTIALKEKPTKAPIPNEAANGLKNLRGTVAMARTPDPHSATAQFFINTVDNAFLNYRSSTDEGWGYCVFGKVVKGLDVVDSIAKTPTGNQGMYENVPIEAVIIKKATVVKNTMGGEKKK